jgi:hypothetical protein
LKISMPFGGHSAPVARERASWIGSPENRLASKKAQNQATKNMISEAMKRIMP